MDLTFDPSQEAFRHELRQWLQDNCSWEYGVGLPPRFEDLADEVAFLRDWQGRLAGGRWVGVAWPEEFGGRGLGPAEHFVVQEELARARAPELVGRIGINLAGPTLLAHGNDAQKERWLRKILSAEELWCQLFSEPGAGSDLASVATRATSTMAVRDGDEWVINGQKVWTSVAHLARWGMLAARSDPDQPKHKGLTYFVIDMHAPGVDVRPLRQLTGDAEFNEVFLDEVFVPEDQLIGPLHGGWQVANATLSHERGINPRQLVIHIQLLDELVRLAQRTGAMDDWRLRQRVAQAFVEVRLFQLHNWRTLSRLEKGGEPGPEGSILKLYWSEMSKRLHETAMAVLGPAAPLWRGGRDNPGDGTWQRSWLYYQASSIFAGTNEIQRNIAGEREPSRS